METVRWVHCINFTWYILSDTFYLIHFIWYILSDSIKCIHWIQLYGSIGSNGKDFFDPIKWIHRKSSEINALNPIHYILWKGLKKWINTFVQQFIDMNYQVSCWKFCLVELLMLWHLFHYVPKIFLFTTDGHKNNRR